MTTSTTATPLQFRPSFGEIRFSAQGPRCLGSAFESRFVEVVKFQVEGVRTHRIERVGACRSCG